MDFLKDRFERRLNYVRISITDRCNYRCLYCMPEEGIKWIPHDRIMTYEEILFLAQVLKGLGVEKIRFTGGEPLVRKGFFPFLDTFSASVPGVRTVLTTNGSLISQYIDEIKWSGLSGVNVSLDTLDEALFRFITRGGRLQDVIEGVGLLSERTEIPIKINTVLMKGVNDGEVEALLDFAKSHRAVLRLIEFMPLDDSVWKGDLFIPASVIFQKLPDPDKWERLDYSSDHGAGPARYYRNSSTGQEFGLIEAVSHHFCDSCNRLRVSATGIMRPCLFSEEGVFLRPALLSGNAAEVKALVVRAVSSKPGSYNQARSGAMHMSRIGG
ncbi:MAG: GTP 3',8-cyclase MoaA [Thermovirgaceae bacterium]|nr:GTP 3',8-cyclase MoaA [Synergistales bacterium]HPC75104.1 GTP 3',8-cyclase MoaA [Synergistales bacterium]HRS48424.1 GTP 3',8-cyclase MoaA [Thermovirgaceae bacterium]HRU90346.1 GTP 3',8-cyclase MoaA [Thermovirgaceae bacterium]